MSQTQYLKMLEKEIQRINKIIDHKIVHGQEYAREMKDHKLILRKVQYLQRRSILQRLFPRLSARHAYASHVGGQRFVW